MKTESLITIYMYDSRKWFTCNVYEIVFCKQEPLIAGLIIIYQEKINMLKRSALLLTVLAVAFVFFASTVYAQNQNAGIQVNASGELKMNTVRDNSIKAIALQARKSLGSAANETTEMRCVSLRALEKAIEANNYALTEEMKYLAGLTRIEYVFFDPENKDVIIAGPAENWVVYPELDRVVGIKSGRPVVRLEDLVAALRLYGPDGSDPTTIGCSIDPTAEGLARFQQYVRTVNPYRMSISEIRNGMTSSIGNYNVRIDGVSPNTHFAKVLVEADYRMKLIGIGLENAPAGVRSFISAASASDVAQNALCRWYFVPNYQCVKMSDDGNAIQLVGQGVKLVGEDEVIAADGSRALTGGSQNPASRAFTRSFTDRYEKVSMVSPVYAELRNLIDIAIVAAYLNQEGIFAKAEWTMPTLGDETKYSIETCSPLKFAPAACNVVSKGGRLMTPTGGGVQIQPQVALNDENLVDNNAKFAKVSQLPEGKWWWNN